jgi:hypothetical protein
MITSNGWVPNVFVAIRLQGDGKSNTGSLGKEYKFINQSYKLQSVGCSLSTMGVANLKFDASLLDRRLTSYSEHSPCKLCKVPWYLLVTCFHTQRRENQSGKINDSFNVQKTHCQQQGSVISRRTPFLLVPFVVLVTTDVKLGLARIICKSGFAKTHLWFEVWVCFPLIKQQWLKKCG